MILGGALTVPEFDQVRLGKAKEIISRGTHKLAAPNWLFISGEHWNGGRFWIGPRPRLSDTNHALIMRDLRSGFVFRNVLEEIVDNHTEGVMGREAGINVNVRRATKKGEKLEKEEQDDIDEVEAAFTDWMSDEDRDAYAELTEFARTTLWAERACIRVFVPEGHLERVVRNDESTGFKDVEEFEVSANDLADAMSKIYIQNVPIQQAFVYRDPNSRRKLAIYIYMVGSKQYLEMSWVDPEDGMTIIRTMKGEQQAQPDVRMNLGGRLHVIMGRRRGLLVDESLQQQQKALNLCLTCLPKNVITGGWLERVLLNAQSPGDWELNENGEKVRFVPKPYYTGPNTTNFVQGAQYEDEDAQGNKITRMANASVAWRDPVPITSSADGERALYTVMMESAKQGHLVEGNDYTSGRAKIESRNQYIGSLRKTKRVVEPVGRAVFETVLAMCEHILNTPGRYTGPYRVLFTCKLDGGAVPAEERAQYAADVENFLLPAEYAMELMGNVDDVDAAMTQIAADPRYQLQQAGLLADALSKWMALPGMTFAIAAKALKLDPDMVMLLESVPPPPKPEPAPPAK